MTENFDSFIISALVPPERGPDRLFVARVQARIALEHRLHDERRAMLGRFMEQLAGLMAVAAGVWWIGRMTPVANWFAESPGLGLGLLIAVFAFLIGIFSLRRDGDSAFASI